MLLHGRIGLAALLTVAVAATLPAAAMAVPPSHRLALYKVEKQVDLGSDDETVSISCETGDYAIQGMGRIDHVDQDDDFYLAPHILYQGVQIVASYGDSANAATWKVRFIKDAPGDAQAKVFAVCLPGSPQAGTGHTHAWSLSSSTSLPFDVTAASGATPELPTTGTCSGANAILVAPGWTIDYDSGVRARVVGSMPSTSSLTTWDWAFNVTTFTASVADIELSWRCLTKKSTGTHTHKIVVSPWSAPTSSTSLPAAKQTEVVRACGQQYKAVLGGFWFGVSGWGSGGPWTKLFFQGMDPRPKKRAFRFINSDSSAHPVWTTVVCFNDRTT